MEGRGADGDNEGWDIYGREGAAAVKGRGADGFQLRAFAKGHCCEGGAAVEGPVADGGNGRRDDDGREGGAVFEGIAGD